MRIVHTGVAGAMSLLTVNSGSSSLKLAVYDNDAAMRKAAVSVERIGSPGTVLRFVAMNRTTTRKLQAIDHAAAVNEIFNHLPEFFESGIRAAGHRLVHGGMDHHEPERITPALVNDLKKLQDIDRTHTPQALAVIEAVTQRFADVPQFG